MQDIDKPLSSNQAGGYEPPAEQVNMLADMGFTPAQAKKALCETVSFFIVFCSQFLNS